jgi:hypothetical protein
MRGLPEEVAAKAKRRDLAPTVVQKPDGEVVVSICIFSAWGGVQKVPIRMKASFPHNPEEDEEGARILVPYDSGIRF